MATNGRDEDGTSVLIVEDEAIVARDLQRTLEDMGYRVTSVAASSDAALTSALECAPDLVLMDIRIQGALDGIETADLLRARFGVPIVYLTAYADDETLGRAMRTEPYGYIVKPFTRREVRSAIEIARYKHEMDARVAERERWFATTLRSIGEAVVACDPERRIHFMNRSAEQLTGWTEHEARGRRVEEVVRLITDGEAAPIAELIGQALDERSLQSVLSNTRLVRRDGTDAIAIDDSIAPIVCDGVLLGAVLVFRDISEQRRMQDKVAISERLASLGNLAAGICHEINNPLTFIIANAHFLESAVDGWERQLRERGSFELADRTWKAKEALDDLRQGAERIRRIVVDLSLFGRPVDEPNSPIDVRNSVEWALRVCAAQIRTRAYVTKELRPVPPVMAGETKLAQVLINLLANAAHAIPEGEPERHTIRVATDTDSLGRVAIEVEDTGSGIPAPIMSRIFEPFFTTREVGMGSGLGLSICHGIVESLHGEISVRSGDARGSVFRVVLPAAPVTPIRPQPLPIDPPARHGRILVVDDEPGFLRAVSALLEGEHEVVGVEDAREALRLIESGESFDLVLCDVVMPGFGGMDLYERIKRSLPALSSRFVFVTGGAFTARAADFLAATPNARIQKPFDPAALRVLLQRELHDVSGPKPG